MELMTRFLMDLNQIICLHLNLIEEEILIDLTREDHWFLWSLENPESRNKELLAIELVVARPQIDPRVRLQVMIVMHLL